MINDMCNSISGHQRHIISKKKNMMSKKKRNKNDKIPRDRDWTLTTDRNMVWSDALPTELRGTCQNLRLNLNSCFRCPKHWKDQAWKHRRSSIGRKESRFNGLQWTQLVKRNSGHLDLPFLFLFFYWRISMGLTDNRTTAKHFAVRLKKLKNFNRFWS